VATASPVGRRRRNARSLKKRVEGDGPKNDIPNEYVSNRDVPKNDNWEKCHFINRHFENDGSKMTFTKVAF
jgi:hypothetical protein